MPEANDKVDVKSSAYEEMESGWDLIHDLCGGTEAMRAAGEKWLPREPKELPDFFIRRLNRTFLFNATADTIDQLGSKPFSRAVGVSGTMSDALAQIEGNADLAGTNLTQFAHELFTAGEKYGLSHILVDQASFQGSLTLADQKRLNIRPRFIHVPPTNLLGWRSQLVNGVRQLTQIRILETQTEPDGTFGDQQVRRVRVFNYDPETKEGSWELWKDNGKEFVPESSDFHDFPGIPLVTFYMNKTGYMTAETPFKNLAWMNIAHWQSQSDQRNILRMARSGLLAFWGVTDEELLKLAIGPNAVLAHPNTEARGEYIEHSGKAIAAGERDLERLREAMEVLGAQPLIRQTVNTTATGIFVGENKNDSNIQAWIRALEAALVTAYGMGALWMQEKPPTDLGVDIRNDFGITARAGGDIDKLHKMRTAIPPQITHETFLKEVRRRGTLSEDLDIEAEIEKLKHEDPLFGIPLDDDDDDPTDGDEN